MKKVKAYNVQIWIGLKEGYHGIEHTIDEVYGGIIGYCKQILSTTEEDIKTIRENYLR